MMDASRYSIQVRKVNIDGEDYYHAKIKEFPYLNEYAETHEEAYNLAIDAIETSATVLKGQGKEIPQPAEECSEEDYSGRVTLRIPRTLHASLSKQAEYEDISLNQLLTAVLSEFNGFNNTRHVTHTNLARSVISNAQLSVTTGRYTQVASGRSVRIVAQNEQKQGKLSEWALEA